MDQLPMYGGMDRSAEAQLQAADEVLIEDTMKEFGSREKAGAAYVERGFLLYRQDDLAAAMRRFNHAWVIDPDNPGVYWGFASVLQDQGNNCEAMEMVEKALGYNQYLPGLYPDAGRMIVLCAMSDPKLSPAQKKHLFDRSDALFAEAAKKDYDKGYVYSSWATAYYWRGQYADAWRMVTKTRGVGGTLPEAFLSALRKKMREP
jgi:Tfp pilus assembly protein PilF